MAVELKPKDLVVPHKQVAQAGLASTGASVGEVRCMSGSQVHRNVKRAVAHGPCKRCVSASTVHGISVAATWSARSIKKTLKHRRPLAIMHRKCNALGRP